MYDYENQGIVIPTGRRTRGYVDSEGRDYKGYKEYDEEALLKLRQVAIFKKLDMKRCEIKKRMTRANLNCV